MIHNVSEVKQWTKGTMMIGETLFVDGSPHKFCLICGDIIKQVDAFNQTTTQRGVRGKVESAYIERKVLVGHWLVEYEETWNPIVHAIELVRKPKPIVRQVTACFTCWNQQQREKAWSNGKMIFFPDKDLIQPPGKTTPLITPKKREFVVKASAPVDTASRSHNTQHALMMDVVDRYIPIMVWHVPLVDPGMATSVDQIAKAFVTVGHIGRKMLKDMNGGNNEDVDG